MIDFIIIIIGLSGGLVVGGAFAAFISLLEIIPRLIHVSQTKKHKILYQNAYILGVITSTVIYFYNIKFQLNDLVIGIIGLFLGTYLGLFSSALAEVLNVIPVMMKKLKLKNESNIMIYALILGKIAGSLFFWLKFK
ncbi:MAG: stage V sporulation protein AB [Tissierellaceae bacterium]|nr:stage V sporulation protein AB [Tissierellaceae bacterium]